MMTELVFVEGVSDVQLISYYLQNVYGWKHERDNMLRIEPLDEHEHIESLSKNGNQLVLCGVGGNGKFAHFVKKHRVNDMIVEQDISSLMVVTDRDEASDANVRRVINNSLEKVSVNANQWKDNVIEDSFGQTKHINTYLLIIPEHENGALERVIIDALNDIPQETALIQEVVQFIDSLKANLVTELNQTNKANKATVGTFFSVRYPKDAMRKFGVVVSKIDWSQSPSLNHLFLPFQYLGEDKPIEN
ncbi:MAG: DUF3226 domain-containing protein [Lachnospiraceae bacterium]|nr:DUF3226 domain-containing protein [Lachnospiraceae bacterium]